MFHVQIERQATADCGRRIISSSKCCLLTAPAFADSQARVVRFSEVQGKVQVDRNTGRGFKKAFLNLPVAQGLKLQTKHDGRAEVEFEDGRVTPDTVVAFPQLSLRESGAKETNSWRGGNYAPASQLGAWHGGGASSASAGHSSSGHSSAH
jgi:hypothetical protein